MSTSRRKNICFVVSSVGTAKSFLKEPFKILSNEFNIYLVANVNDSDDMSDMYLSGYKNIPIERYPNLKQDYKALCMLISYFKDMNFDCVHSLTKKASLLTTIAGRIAKIPYRLHHFTGQMWCTMTGLRKYLHKKIDSFIARSDTHKLVDGKSQREFLENNGVLKAGQAEVLANGSICGINITRFSPNHCIRKQLRSELNISEEQVVYIFLGRLKREKGAFELLEAFNQLVLDCPKALLLIVGVDEEKCLNTLQNYSNIKLGNNLIYYGRTDKPENLYNVADVYVLPTYREGFGLAILEASSTGLPVITTDTYGVRDSIIENQTGLRSKTRDVGTLHRCMYQLYFDPIERRRLGENGIKYVHDNFTSELVCAAWLDYYRRVVK